MGIFRTLQKWASICLAVSAIAGCGGSSDSSCSGTVFYNAYSYAGAPSGEVGIAYSYTPSISISGCRPSDRVSAGSLPPGLNLDSGTGRITGVPTQGGNYTLTVSPNAGGNVYSTFTISIYPQDSQAPALTTRRLAIATDLPSRPPGTLDRLAMAITAVDHGDGWVLYAGNNARSISGLAVYKSTDMGIHWTVVPQVGGPGTNNVEFRFASGSGNLYVFETGSSYSAPILYRFDGSAWHLVNNALPFSPTPAAGFHVGEDGVMLVGWASILWQSTDWGVTWAQIPTSAAQGIPDRITSTCVGTAGTDVRMVQANGYPASPDGQAVDLKLSAGSATWSVYNWQIPTGFSKRGTDLAVSCVSARSRFWVSISADPYPSPMHLAMSGAGAGSNALDFPRRMPGVPSMHSLGRMGNNIVGLARNATNSAWEIWVFE